MIKKIIIRQPAGIGDIFFCQKIAHILYQTYNVEIIWPVIPEFTWIENYIKIPFIKFVNWEEDFEGKHILLNNDVSHIFTLHDYLIVPLQRADWNYPGLSVMDAKYKMVNLEQNDWLDYFEFERDLEREQKLIDHYNLQNKEFVFVNKMFGSPPYSKPCPHMGIYENSIEMEYLGWDNLFDWIGLLLKAKHIYTVETSILYIISKLGLKNVTVYSRYESPSFHQIEHIFDKDLTYIL
jgi:hypothetical protein